MCLEVHFKFRNINFKDWVLWHALKPRKNSRLQSKEGNATYRKSRTTISCPQTLSPFKGVENVGGYCLGRGTAIAAWTLIAILSRYEEEAEKQISMLFI